MKLPRVLSAKVQFADSDNVNFGKDRPGTLKTLMCDLGMNPATHLCGTHGFRERLYHAILL
jgi:hypothetical protein